MRNVTPSLTPQKLCQENSDQISVSHNSVFSKTWTPSHWSKTVRASDKLQGKHSIRVCPATEGLFHTSQIQMSGISAHITNTETWTDAQRPVVCRWSFPLSFTIDPRDLQDNAWKHCRATDVKNCYLHCCNPKPQAVLQLRLCPTKLKKLYGLAKTWVFNWWENTDRQMNDVLRFGSSEVR